MLNSFAVEGYLSDDVSLSFDDAKKVSKASFHLNNPSGFGKKTFYNEFYVVVYGKKAENCASSLAKGKKCTISGKVTTWFYYDDNGNKQEGVTINASDVFWD